ncbi:MULTISPECIES: ABC transporter permease [Streptosporangium]|uniref:Alpha-glucoside transport system permease protein n=1 Tax=Streptosporangium brasiliense TaxID=47480 RepID=A0ABT9R0X5_9ACTN|nr:ABC transporter permease subunit [Streptosporangium brasiliense]MDP9862492.1 alpha-glucoside transport system permease protein [Streptosporangium brasiliense]
MTDRLDGPQDPRGGGDAARGSSSGPNDTPGASLDLSDAPPAPADAGADAPAAKPEIATAGPAAPAASGAATTSRTSSRLGPPPTLAIWFLLPGAILLGSMVIYPIIYSIFRSFYDATGGTFVGVDNYATIFSDSSTLTTIRNNLIWVVVAPALVTVVGLIFAVLTERIRWATAFKLIVFMPMAVSLMASGVIFRLVYEQDPDRGVANAVITSVQDVFDSNPGYPDARPRGNDQAPVAAQQGAVVTKQPAKLGQAVLIPLVGVKPDTLASASAAKAVQPGPGELAGTVWVDFTQGGGGALNQVDGTEKALAGMTVEAVQNGTVKGTATTEADGTFRFAGLAPGDYLVRLPQSNFEAAFNGIPWLGPTLITPAIIGAFIWVWAGFSMVLIAAGLSAIPRDALEAARIDGATEWQVFRKITVPLLSPVLLVVFVTMIINTLKVFDLVFVIAPGSVQPQANVIALEMWRVSFGGGGNQGLGSALAIFLLILVLPFMILNIRRFRRDNQ